MSRIGLICAFLCCLFGNPACAQAGLAPIPALSRPLTDVTATLNAEQVARLEADIRAFEQRKGSQIAVLIVPTTQPEAIEQYAIRVAEQWKIGRKKIDDGAILIVARDDRALRIEVGYGLEGALNDATSKRIVDDIIVPHFKSGDFDGGIAAGVGSMMKVIDGEPLPAPQRQPARGADGGLRQILPVFLVVAVVLGGVLRAVLGRFVGAAATGAMIGVVAWLLAGVGIAVLAGMLGFLLTLIGGGRGGLGGMYMGGGRGSGGWGGSGGGGGSWGGGGGGFGGGGASGRW